MKITNINMIGGRGPVSPAAMVQVHTDEGEVGIGSTSAPIPVIAALVEDLKPLLVGEDATRPNHLWRKMFEGWQSQRGRGGEGGVAVNAMAAIDMAIWDAAGKALGKPIHQLLGGAIKPRIMVYASATAYDYLGSRQAGQTQWKSADQLADESRAYVSEGFKAIKFGWGNRYEPADIEKLAAIREAIGPDTLLMLDFGCPAYNCDGWNVRDAAPVVRRLDPFDLFFFEEALHPYDVEGFAELTRLSPIKIATGESLVTLRDFDHFIHRRAVDVIQPDAQQIGITTFRRVADHAEAAGMLCIPHCPWTAMAVAAHLQVLCTFTNGVLIEYPATAGFRGVPFMEELNDVMSYRIVDTPVTYRDGYIEVDDRPGLGIGQYVPEAVAKLDAMTPVKYP